MRSEGKDKVFNSYMQFTLDIDVSLHGGIPPRRPPDQEMRRHVSHDDAPFIDPGGMGALGGRGTTLRVLGRLKEEGDILPTSSLPTLISNSAPRKEQHGKDRNLPIYDSGMGYVKEKGNHMTYFLCDRSSVLSLWKIDPYWKSQLLVDYSKDIFTCMILDEYLH